jgi:hypothetical protein
VILTTLHSGGKFSGKAYDTSGGLHGVGSSVVNALSDSLEVEVARGGELFRQSYARGKPVTRLKREGEVRNRRGTLLRFHPDPEIFGKLEFRAERLFRLCRSKAYLYRGVEIRWRCAPELVQKTKRAARLPPRRRCTSRAGCRISSPQPSRARPWWSLPPSPAGRFPRPRRALRMGDHLAGAWRGLPIHLRQHHPDAAGRHARGGLRARW